MALTPARVGLFVGTRPEAVKMSPVARRMTGVVGLQPVVITTGQHTDLLDTAMASLTLASDEDLRIAREVGDQAELAGRLLEAAGRRLRRGDLQAVLVQGDTTSCVAIALAAYYERVPLGHVEAGLRTRDHDHPFPEEGNRQIIDRLATWCFAPTELARSNLLEEALPSHSVFVTGNTAVDALLWLMSQPGTPERPLRDYVLVTLHRRESFGEPLRRIVSGVTAFLEAEPMARVVWPLHPNPQVRKTLEAVRLPDRAQVTPPLPYAEFVRCMAGARFVLTDSGGVQEEAPSLGLPVLVARETTERPEGVASGHNRIVGRDSSVIAREMAEAWNAPVYRGDLPAPNPYGDGRAAERIVDILRRSICGDDET